MKEKGMEFEGSEQGHHPFSPERRLFWEYLDREKRKGESPRSLRKRGGGREALNPGSTGRVTFYFQGG